ncbi:hypothetical protein GGI1_02802 [Acidithiobacillus sp. GGI-221]|nr:hypothetical protein GGI1_02802 [Acidithiobacillus sp. GGI-221]
MLEETMQVEVTYGQDTACYYTETIDMPVGMAEQEIRVFLRNRATQIAYDEDGPAFEPEYDFSNLRVVTASTRQSEKQVMLVEDMGVEPRYHDSGLLLATALKDRNLSAFLEAVGECGKSREEAIAAIAAFSAQVNEVESNGQV